MIQQDNLALPGIKAKFFPLTFWKESRNILSKIQESATLHPQTKTSAICATSTEPRNTRQVVSTINPFQKGHVCQVHQLRYKDAYEDTIPDCCTNQGSIELWHLRHQSLVTVNDSMWPVNTRQFGGNTGNTKKVYLDKVKWVMLNLCIIII
jgi:hypothetical protein